MDARTAAKLLHVSYHDSVKKIEEAFNRITRADPMERELLLHARDVMVMLRKRGRNEFDFGMLLTCPSQLVIFKNEIVKLQQIRPGEKLTVEGIKAHFVQSSGFHFSNRKILILLNHLKLSEVLNRSSAAPTHAPSSQPSSEGVKRAISSPQHDSRSPEKKQKMQ